LEYFTKNPVRESTKGFFAHLVFTLEAGQKTPIDPGKKGFGGNIWKNRSYCFN